MMTPRPKESIELESLDMDDQPAGNPADFGEEIVISGFSGSFPDSNGVYEFRDNLMNKVNLINPDERRWRKANGEMEYPHATGKMLNIEKFDAGFFGINAKQADVMDPLIRIELERSYEAILDSGINPNHLRGSRTGVFTGACFSETERVWIFDETDVNGLGILNCSRGLTANRISYHFGLEGPSLVTDTACSSSLFALDRAIESMRTGQCDAALVIGSTACLHPFVSKQFYQLGVLSDDAQCKCFDENANGYARSEAVVVIFLQKAKDARRVYARLVHSKVNCDGYKDSGITFPSRIMQLQLMTEFYKECNVDPTTVSYVEAHATGTVVGDPEECGAIDQAFCTGRKVPLLIGSIKSNMGHSEPSSGLCSVVKALIALDCGIIPPNLNLVNPKQEITGIKEGRMKVVTEPTPLPGNKGLIAVSSFGFGGANAHILLEWNKKKEKVVPKDNIPRLVLLSGRHKEAINTVFDDIKSRPFNVEFLQLINDIYSDRVYGHETRGFAIFTVGGEKYRQTQDINWISSEDVKKNVTLVLPGLGGNIPYLARSLLKLPPFLASIEASHAALMEVKFDLMSVITEDSVFASNIINSIVGHVAFQLALLDCVSVSGILPDKVLGYSVGEIACAYACRNLSTKQAVSTAYFVGKTLMELQVNGVKPQLHQFSGTPVAQYFVSALRNVIPSPQPRSKNWITSSTKNMVHGEDVANSCSAEFFAHMLTTPLDIETAVKSLPEDNIVVEINTSNKRLIPQSLLLTDATATDNSVQVLMGIGKVYCHGVDVTVAGFYPTTPYPVSRNTPMIAPLVRWDHSRDWFVMKYDKSKSVSVCEYNVTVNLNITNDAYLMGHAIDGRILYPATGYVTLLIEQMSNAGLFAGLDIIYVFKNVQFHRATTLSTSNETTLRVNIQRSAGYFEISEGGGVIVTGLFEFIKRDEFTELTGPDDLTQEAPDDSIVLRTKDIYKELRLRGYHYSGLFKGLDYVQSSGKSGKVKWNDNVVSFMDTMLQMQILNLDSRDLYVPVAIGKIVIDFKTHLKAVQRASGASTGERDENVLFTAVDLDISFDKDVNVLRSGGIEIWNLRAQQISRRKPLGEPVLEKYSFVPSIVEMPQEDLHKAEGNFSIVLRLLIHLALENLSGIKVKTLELLDENLPVVSSYVSAILLDLPLIQAEVQISGSPNKALAEDLPPNVVAKEDALASETDYAIIIGKDLLIRPELLNKAQAALKSGGFLISRDHPDSIISEEAFSLLAQYTTNGEKFTLLRKKPPTIENVAVVHIPPGDDLSWINPLKETLQSSATRVILVSENDRTSGLLGLTNCLLQESFSSKIRCVFVRDERAPKFDLGLPFYAEQLAKDLVINIFENGQWGTYRHQALPDLSLVPSHHVYVNNAVRGDISSLKLFQGPLNKALMKGQIMDDDDVIKVCYASINFKDVMICSGKITMPSFLTQDSELQIGFEFSGINSKGERVMGMNARGAMTNAIRNSLVTWKVPDDMSLADAATIPCVYTTVYLAIVHNGRARAGESILIHSGAGGVGLAAINMSQKLGLEVFVTVGTQEKRKYLRENYPQIPDSHIGNSRDTSFLDMIMKKTGSRGVDLVLNSLADEKMAASLKCLAPGGRFLEIGKYDLLKNTAIDTSQFLHGSSFHSIMVDVALEGDDALKALVFRGMNQCLSLNYAKPLPKTIFEMDEPEKAFRYMTTGKHIGKVLLKVRDENEVSSVSKTYDAVPRFFCNPKGTYVIIGGLGGFGLELANWLVSRGAKNIVVTSRQGIKNGFQGRTIKIWQQSGVNVKISTEDISSEVGVENLLKTANSLSPVAAIYNLAVVLSDAVFENQTEESFNSSFNGKARATAHLDTLSRRLCPQLEEFVVFSSVSCGRGNAGQTNYGMSNSVMERICEKRKAEGFPALAIQWGAIGEVGLVAEMAESNLELVIGGTLQQTISSCLQALDIFLVQDAPVVASMVVAEKRSTRKAGQTIVDAVCCILGIRDIKTVAASSSLSELGMDSMTGVEIKQTLERDFEVFLTAQDLRGMTFGKLAELDAAAASNSNGESAVDKDEIGLRFLISSTPSESEAVVPVYQLPTLSSSGLPAIFIPGLDGIVNNFLPVAKELKFPAVSIRYPHKQPHVTSIQQTAEFMLSKLSSQIDKNDFRLVGYSAGGSVALEMAAILEKQGGKGQVVLIDGAPNMISTLIRLLDISKEPSQIDNSVIFTLQENITSKTVSQDKVKYLAMKTRDEKLDYLQSVVASDISTKTDFTNEYLRSCAVDLMQRVHNIVNFSRTDVRLRSRIVHVTPAAPTCPGLEDFGLSQISALAGEVLTVPGNHLTMLNAPELPGIINKILSKLYYRANCSVHDDVICMGRRRFSKNVLCNWTEGYRWSTALLLSVTLGGFGTYRFYLGHWQEGIGKLFSFGGLGVWTLIDVILIALRYLGPTDGSLYL